MSQIPPNNKAKSIRYTWGVKIFIAVILGCLVLFGAVFEKTVERYAYKAIDFMYQWKALPLCSDSEMIKLTQRTRTPIRESALVETHDSWRIIDNDVLVCPKNTALILIDVWDTENEKHNMIKAEHQKITENVIIPTISKLREHGGIIIHSPNGSKSYPNIVDEEVDTNLSWTVVTPRKFQTLALFWTLRSKGRKTLIYAGFSTNMCLYDRPHGIYFTRMFDDYIERLLLREGTSTWEFSNSNPTFTDDFIKYLEWHYTPSISYTDFFR